jgi:hypothetical protein
MLLTQRSIESVMGFFEFLTWTRSPALLYLEAYLNEMTPLIRNDREGLVSSQPCNEEELRGILVLVTSARSFNIIYKSYVDKTILRKNV